jgi:hypothetical protein
MAPITLGLETPHPRRMKTSTTLLQKPKNSQHATKFISIYIFIEI